MIPVPARPPPERDRPAAPCPARSTRELGDLRFRALLDENAWAALPADVRRRFSRRLADGESAVYVGRASAFRASFAGRVLAQLMRVLGAPLPLGGDIGVASVVIVTEDRSAGGQVWTRCYANRHGFPQVIHSSKRFGGPTGLEESIGYGIGTALEVSVEGRALVFRSAGYSLTVFGRRMALPRWLSPGELCVTHEAIGPGSFRFTLRLQHARFGELLYQAGDYRDVVA